MFGWEGRGVAIKLFGPSGPMAGYGENRNAAEKKVKTHILKYLFEVVVGKVRLRPQRK